MKENFMPICKTDINRTDSTFHPNPPNKIQWINSTVCLKCVLCNYYTERTFHYFKMSVTKTAHNPYMLLPVQLPDRLVHSAKVQHCSPLVCPLCQNLWIKCSHRPDSVVLWGIVSHDPPSRRNELLKRKVLCVEVFLKQL